MSVLRKPVRYDRFPAKAQRSKDRKEEEEEEEEIKNGRMDWILSCLSLLCCYILLFFFANFASLIVCAFAGNQLELFNVL